MLRVEREDRARTTYSEGFALVVIYEGAFDGWYRGGVRTHVAGSLKLKEPGEVHRGVRVHEPFTLQGAVFARELVDAAAAAMGARGSARFKAGAFAPGEPEAAAAFAMHDALVREDATDLERTTRVAEALSAVIAGDGAALRRAPRAIHRARAFLREALDAKVTLDDVAEHAALDKFHLVRAFRAEVGVPPYEYLMHLRVSRAREMLQRGVLVAEAAHAVGFCDESQLHRHFRRIVGISPGLYARQLRPSTARRLGAPSRS